ncbi:MAG: polyphosphate kinase 1 [Bacteroidota bacterium]
MTSTDNFHNRDLSWLKFNYRVLQEAKDTNVPLLERLRFLAIYSSNLDEFFRVRVADIRKLDVINKDKINKKIKFNPGELLEDIHKNVNSQLSEYGETVGNVLDALENEGLFLAKADFKMDAMQQQEVLHYFKTSVLTFIQPKVWEVNESEDFLNNRQLYFAVRLSKDEKEYFGYLNIPSDSLPRFFKLPSTDGKTYFIYLDDIIRQHMDIVFPGYEILECVSIKLNKDADLHIDDEYSGDLVDKIQKQITKRNLGTPSRFLYDSAISEELLDCLQAKFSLSDQDLVPGGRHHNLNDFFQLPNPIGDYLEYEKQSPIIHTPFHSEKSVFKAIEKRDHLLHFPYQSYDYILQFFNEAAINPMVAEINVTFYRMAEKSFIGDALISAAKNGKVVKVFMELKARFDEENNLYWASKMEAAGIKIIYSIPGLKVHAKVALVKMKKSVEGARYYGFYGTGNLNEKTARIYVDHALLTCNEEMNKELSSLFNFLYKRKQPGEFNRLMVSQFNIVNRFTQLIDREIENQKSGKKGHIIIKLNNLEEKNIINKLYEASQAGVKVEMIVRGICCLKPGVPGLSENITIRRLVDKFLEHARIFYFYNDGAEEVVMGSADWMSRNLLRRIEVIFPVTDPDNKAELIEMLKIQLADNTKANDLDSMLEPLDRDTSGGSVRAQMAIYDYVKARRI